MKTLIAKELRENFKWLLVGLALMLVLAWTALPMSVNEPSNRLSECLGFAGALFAICLAVMQTAWDFSDRQQGFILHRAISKNQVIASKIISGAIIYIVVIAIPLLIATIYFAMMGLEYLPIRPLQIVGTVFLTCACYFLHPATLFTMIRPAKWYGTKALPLILPGIVCFFSYISFTNNWIYWTAAVIELLVLVAATMTFTQSRASKAVLTANSFATMVIVGAVLISVLEAAKGYVNQRGLTRDSSTGQGIGQDGNIWEYRYRQVYDSVHGGMKTEYISGYQMSSNTNADLDATLPENFSVTSLIYLSPLDAYSYPAGTIHPLGSTGEYRSMFWDQRGYLLMYDSSKNPPLLGTVTRDGFSPGNNPKGAKFTSNPIGALGIYESTENFVRGLGANQFIADRNGVYLFNQSTGELKIVIDKPIEIAFPIFTQSKFCNQIMIDSGSQWELYEVADIPKSVNQESKPEAKEINVSMLAVYPRLPKAEGQWSLGATSSGKLTATVKEGRKTKIASIAGPNQSEWLIETVEQPEYANNLNNPTVFVVGMIPAILLVCLFSAASFEVLSREGASGFSDAWSEPSFQQFMFACGASFVLVTACTLFVLYFILQHRFTHKRSFIFWFALTPFLGIATPLAVAAIYPRLKFENCPKCDRSRRIDLVKCEHCGSDWEGLPPRGIEIIEGKNLVAATSPF